MNGTTIASSTFLYQIIILFYFQNSMPKIEYFRILNKKSSIFLTKFCSLKKKVFLKSFDNL
jgi:hypothetical protein